MGNREQVTPQRSRTLPPFLLRNPRPQLIVSTSSIQYHSQDPWPSPYDMRASYYVCYTLVLNRSSVSLDHPSCPQTGPEPPKLLSRVLLETDSSGLFPRGSASSFTRGLSLQLNFLFAAILEEKKKNPAWRMVSSSSVSE